jgi:predicted ATPase
VARQTLHAKTAQTLEQQFPDVAQSHPELIAHHLTEGGLFDEAVKYWKLAGERAVMRSANVEAVNHLRQGMETLARVAASNARNKRELDLLAALRPSLVAVRGYAAPEVEQTQDRMRELCEQLDAKDQWLGLLQGQMQLSLLRAHYGAAKGHAKHLLSLADNLPDHRLSAQICNGVTALLLGKFRESGIYLRDGAAQVNPQEHRNYAMRYGVDLDVVCVAYYARTLWLLGYPDQALAQSSTALELAQTSPTSLSKAQAMGMHALQYQMRRDLAGTREWAERTVLHSVEQAFPYWAELGSILAGWLSAQEGHAKDGVERIQHSRKAYEATGARLGISYFLLLEAEAQQCAGEPAKALDCLALALQHVKDTREGYYLAELHRRRGEILLMNKAARVNGEAELSLLRALTIARRQRAKSWTLRAATSLTRLWLENQRSASAQSLLSAVYGEFTEGFDTPDLVEAKRLLTAMSSSSGAELDRPQDALVPQR